MSIVAESAANGGIDLTFLNEDNNNLTLSNGFDPDPVIHEIYFDSGLFTTQLLTGSEQEGTFNLSFVSRTNGTGVMFDNPKLAIPGNLDPPNLPGGETVGFDADFGIESMGNNGYGINEGGLQAGEWLTVNISQLSLDTFMMALDAGNFTIGMHVRSFKGDGLDFSESFVTDISPVPLPAAFWLFGTALIGLIGVAKSTRT